VEDPLFYDLVVNSSWCPIEELADVVAGVCRRRWPYRSSAASDPATVKP
jgi:hypothetical protein